MIMKHIPYIHILHPLTFALNASLEMQNAFSACCMCSIKFNSAFFKEAAKKKSNEMLRGTVNKKTNLSPF